MDELGKLVSVFNHMMERLQQLFSVQQRFVADVSHELRTPLTAIRGNIELMKRYGADAESLEAIDGETARMSRMVEDLLLLARADYGGLTLDLYAVDLDTVISEIYQQTQILARNHGVQLKMARFEPVRVRGNTDRLKQLILNLVNNAIKYTPEGGTVSLSLYQREGQAVLEVTDTGIGIDKEHLARIFDRFFQADPSRTATDGMSGAGLGLSIAQWIAEAHEGSISVESEVGRGSTFTFTMPLLEAQTPVAPEPPVHKYRIPLIGRITER
jgi:signal transduction histidine kinase